MIIAQYSFAPDQSLIQKILKTQTLYSKELEDLEYFYSLLSNSKRTIINKFERHLT